MSLNSITTEQIMIAENQIDKKEHIISTIIEFSTEIEQAFINILFNGFVFNSDLKIDTKEADYLYLLWKILQDAKKLK